MEHTLIAPPRPTLSADRYDYDEPLEGILVALRGWGDCRPPLTEDQLTPAWPIMRVDYVRRVSHSMQYFKF